MGKTVKNADKGTHARYVSINGQKVYLTKPQQQAYDKMINDVRHAAQREGRCGQSDYHLCFGDCGVCPYQTVGKIVSTDEDGYVEKSDAGAYQSAGYPRPVEDAVLGELMLDELYRMAGLRERNGDQILRLYLEEGLSSYKIADRIGMRQTTVNDELKRLLAYIRGTATIFSACKPVSASVRSNADGHFSANRVAPVQNAPFLPVKAEGERNTPRNGGERDASNNPESGFASYSATSSPRMRCTTIIPQTA